MMVARAIVLHAHLLYMMVANVEREDEVIRRPTLRTSGSRFAGIKKAM